jgi:NAD(P)-dependent dehydrogenase (short-subunit alcohol dehydrogenase family)
MVAGEAAGGVAARPLRGKVALVTGATRGAGRAIAVELSRAGATVYATGRSSRVLGASEIGRPETIEETGDLMAAADGDRYAQFGTTVWEHDLPGGLGPVTAPESLYAGGAVDALP